MWFELCISIVSGLVLLVAYIRWSQAYWQRCGVPSIPPMFLFGNFGEMLFRKKAMPYIIQDLYKTFKDKGNKFGGVYQLLLPMLMVTDPEIIREITVKHFDHFIDRKPLATEKSDELLSRSLLVIEGEKWRTMRHTLSPAYTGSKLRNMTELMTETGQKLVKYLTTIKESEINIREIFRRFTADVIATTAYGTVFDSITDPNNEFYKQANKVLDLKGLRGLVLVGYILSPKLMEILKIPLIPLKMKEYFFNIIFGSIKYREERNMTRPDMIQLLIDARKEQLNNKKEEKDCLSITDMDIVSQAVTIFLGGFESVTTTLSFCTLEIVAHPAIQERLRKEIDTALLKSNGKLNYDVLHELKYMDMVFSEVQRKYPAIPMTDRKCTKKFEMPEYGLIIEPGTVISLPIYALHHDPDYFPEPELFNPERFSEENKHKIQAFTNIPFGVGPRNCIGMRFSLLQMKLCMAYLLSTCELDVCERTPLPVRLSPLAPLIAPEGDFWIAVRPREQPTLKFK